MSRVMIVSDDVIMRLGLRQLLQQRSSCSVVAEARDVAEGIARYLELRPDVVVMSLHMRHPRGPSAFATLRMAATAARVLVVSSQPTDEEMRQALHEGVLGIVQPGAEGDELFRAVEQVARGRAFVSDALSALLRAPGRAPLNVREREILRLLAKGLRNRAIAAEVGLTPGTVRIYVSRLLEKLGVANRTEAVANAVGRGLLRQA